MKEGFEKVFSEIQTDMVAICLEYVEGRADAIYIYGSCEGRVITSDYFYKVNGLTCKKHELPKGYDVSIERQDGCLDIMMEDMMQLKAACREYEADMPTEIRLVYDVKKNSLNASYRYDNVYTDTDLDSNDITAKWFQEVSSEA